jgi:hypothetical protein
MVTKLLLQVFKDTYDAENERYTQLESRAKFYLTVISFYLGAIAFKFADVLKFLEQYRISGAVYIGAGVLLSFSLLLTILATRIRGYEGAFDLEKISEDCKSSMPKEEDFLIGSLAAYRVATRKSRRTNDRVANLLSGQANTV